MEGTLRHRLCPAVPLRCAACWPQSHRPTQPSPKPVATSILALSSANLTCQVVWEDGFKYWPQPNSPTVGICQGNYGAPTIFMEKRFILLEKILLYTWGKHWKDLYQNANRDFFLDGEIISIINVFLCIIRRVFLVSRKSIFKNLGWNASLIESPLCYLWQASCPFRVPISTPLGLG